MTVASAIGRWARRRWPVLLGGCVVLAVGYGAAWYAATARLEAGIASAMQQAEDQGWHIASDPGRRLALPWAASVRLPHVVATRLVGGQPLRWTADQVDVTVSPLDPAAIHLDAAGPQTIALGAQVLAYATRRARLRLPFAGDTARLTAEGVATPSGPAGLAIDTLTIDLAPLAISAGADGVTLTPPLPAPFQGPAALSIRAVSTAPFVTDAPGAPTSAAATWRTAGGRVDVEGFVLQWGPLDAQGTATGTLDAALQPTGRATLKVRGATDVLDAATRAGLVPASPAQAARAVLALLTMAAQGGPITLPITLRDRTLSVAQFPLARLSVLDW